MCMYMSMYMDMYCTPWSAGTAARRFYCRKRVMAALREKLLAGKTVGLLCDFQFEVIHPCFIRIILEWMA